MPASDPPPAQFPSPQVFSLLPQVHALLLRLQPPNTALDSSGSLGDGSEAQNNQHHLLLKELPSAAAPIRLKIAKAKTVVGGLPDIERTVDEQEVEIKALEERVRRLKARLGKMDHSH